MAEPRRQGVFTIPSVEEMKRASMITSGEDGANRFRATASESVSDKPRPQPRPPREREEESSCGLALRPGGVGVKESAVDLAVSDVATVQEGGRRAGEWSGGGDAVAMSTAAETSGAASTHQPHPHAIVANPVQVAHTLTRNTSYRLIATIGLFEQSIELPVAFSLKTVATGNSLKCFERQLGFDCNSKVILR